MKKLNKKGFTLIELLVVVAIIAILAGIVLVSLNSARDRSEKASLQSTMASVMPVLSMCDNDGGTISDVAVDTAICSDVADITEEWPVLPDNLSGYSYAYDSTNEELVGYEGTPETGTPILECSVATGSCGNYTAE
jgi:prepilin-type N-terminal cleavage/methylation domain-containing protein